MVTHVMMYYVQVLEVVRNNYDTLTLKLQDGLDQFDKYSEKPAESAFVTQLVSGFVFLLNRWELPFYFLFLLLDPR